MISCSDHNKCVSDSFEQAKEICNKNGLRFTDLRQKIFSIILQNHQPSKAYDVLGILQKEDFSAKPATIYRALDFLLECGLIHKLHISNSYVVCSHPLRHNRCFFLICNKCDEAQECCDKGLSVELDKIGSKNNFHVEYVAVEIRGICNSCAIKI
jgi:Fur family zinc uptake transcriptional regulator